MYSMTSTSIADMPRAMRFLFDSRRLNVGSSRARVACIGVASPRLPEAGCTRTEPVSLANRVCFRGKRWPTLNQGLKRHIIARHLARPVALRSPKYVADEAGEPTICPELQCSVPTEHHLDTTGAMP